MILRFLAALFRDQASTALPHSTELLIKRSACLHGEESSAFMGLLHHTACQLFAAAIKTMQQPFADGQKSGGEAELRVMGEWEDKSKARSTASIASRDGAQQSLGQPQVSRVCPSTDPPHCEDAVPQSLQTPQAACHGFL